jgi:hypothetical protein
MGDTGLEKSRNGRLQAYDANEQHRIPVLKRWLYSCISDSVPVKIIK